MKMKIMPIEKRKEVTEGLNKNGFTTRFHTTLLESMKVMTHSPYIELN